MFEYDASQDDELTLRVGDIIRNVKEVMTRSLTYKYCIIQS